MDFFLKNHESFSSLCCSYHTRIEEFAPYFLKYIVQFVPISYHTRIYLLQFALFLISFPGPSRGLR